jgi:hypothetical protein
MPYPPYSLNLVSPLYIYAPVLSTTITGHRAATITGVPHACASPLSKKCPVLSLSFPLVPFALIGHKKLCWASNSLSCSCHGRAFSSRSLPFPPVMAITTSMSVWLSLPWSHRFRAHAVGASLCRTTKFVVILYLLSTVDRLTRTPIAGSTWHIKTTLRVRGWVVKLTVSSIIAGECSLGRISTSPPYLCLCFFGEERRASRSLVGHTRHHVSTNYYRTHIQCWPITAGFFEKKC